MIVGLTGGVDTHADVHVAAAIDHNGGLLGLAAAFAFHADQSDDPRRGLAAGIASRLELSIARLSRERMRWDGQQREAMRTKNRVAARCFACFPRSAGWAISGSYPEGRGFKSRPRYERRPRRVGLPRFWKRSSDHSCGPRSPMVPNPRFIWGNNSRS